MALQKTENISLMLQYDELCRYTKVLTAGCEEEFKTFVEDQLNYFKKCKESESQMRKMHKKISRLESEKMRLETQIKLLKNVHLDAENRRRKVEIENNSLKRQIELIKELLADDVMNNQTKEKFELLSSCKQSSTFQTCLEAIEESIGSMVLSDIDRIEDDLISANLTRQFKEKRSSFKNKIIQKKKENLDQKCTNDKIETNYVPPKRIATCCNSEPASTSENEILPGSTLRSDSTQNKDVLFELWESSSASLSGTPDAFTQYSTEEKLNRQHIFVSKVLYRPEKCNPCQNNIGFFNQALKCQDCAVICHPECKDKCTVLCIPIVHTPNEKTTATVADSTSFAAPMISSLNVHSVNKIESLGLVENCLYHLSGIDNEVNILKEKFLNCHSIPLLHRHDINATCSTIKDFLRSLNEPLITQSVWHEFVYAADLKDTNKSLKSIYDIVCSLPQPNRETLAFLFLYLQRVVTFPECKIPILSLAKFFGPTVIDYSVPYPPEMNILKETKDQHKVMERLLSISPESWKRLLNIEPDVLTNSLNKTLENIPALKETQLESLVPARQRIKNAN